eukprot:gene13588-biopygen3680
MKISPAAPAFGRRVPTIAASGFAHPHEARVWFLGRRGTNRAEGARRRREVNTQRSGGGTAGAEEVTALLAAW